MYLRADLYLQNIYIEVYIYIKNNTHLNAANCEEKCKKKKEKKK